MPIKYLKYLKMKGARRRTNCSECRQGANTFSNEVVLKNVKHATLKLCFAITSLLPFLVNISDQ